MNNQNNHKRIKLKNEKPKMDREDFSNPSHTGYKRYT